MRCEWLEKGSVPGKRTKRLKRRRNLCFVVQLELLFVIVLFFFVVM
jgi:hypothetical protein